MPLARGLLHDHGPEECLIEQICVAARILPVITIGSEEQILPLADALSAGGLRTTEITLRSRHGLIAIQRLRGNDRTSASAPEPSSTGA